MKDSLAERLLAKTMQWLPFQMAEERPYLQAMASYKYDEYQQFAPGIRFVESLALWLQQFPDIGQRRSAYAFVKNRLIFCSVAEMAHLVRSVFPDVVRPLLSECTAKRLGVPSWRVARITRSAEYRSLRRQSLFLGLSDGAHIDVFRRSNSELSHEQIHQSYEVTSDRARDLRRKLGDDLSQILGRVPESEEQQFRFVFLLDDFSGSGTSYLRFERGEMKGKIDSIYRALQDESSGLGSIVDWRDLNVCLVLYMATSQALNTLRERLNQLPGSIDWQVRAVQLLSEEVRLKDKDDADFVALCNDFYDPEVENEHISKGGVKHARLGFAGCAVPLVHSHNTPNNSPFLLWSNPQDYVVRGLFPRIERHKGIS